MASIENLTHVMVGPYRWLQKGDPVKMISVEYDSGYPVYVVEDAAGEQCKPDRHLVMPISKVHDVLNNHRAVVAEYEAIVDRLSNKLADIQDS